MTRRFFYDCEFMEEPNTIELISMGIVGENGEEFYGISTDFHPDNANQWVRENVINQLPSIIGYPELWMSERMIAARILDFLNPGVQDPVELWGYYADYDHVVLCWLFGSMVDLPKGMPKWTRDLKQLAWHLGNPRLPKVNKSREHDALEDAKWNRKVYFFLRKRALGMRLVI